MSDAAMLVEFKRLDEQYVQSVSSSAMALSWQALESILGKF